MPLSCQLRQVKTYYSTSLEEQQHDRQIFEYNTLTSASVYGVVRDLQRRTWLVRTNWYICSTSYYCEGYSQTKAVEGREKNGDKSIIVFNQMKSTSQFICSFPSRTMRISTVRLQKKTFRNAIGNFLCTTECVKKRDKHRSTSIQHIRFPRLSFKLIIDLSVHQNILVH